VPFPPIIGQIRKTGSFFKCNTLEDLDKILIAELKIILTKFQPIL